MKSIEFYSFNVKGIVTKEVPLNYMNYRQEENEEYDITSQI